MRVGEPGNIFDGDPLGRQPSTWLHVQVHNKNLPRWLAWVYNGEPALSCHAWITFHHLDGYPIFHRAMNARWSETPEPIVEVKDTEKRAVARLLNVQDTIEISPGEYADLDIVFRAKSDNECYGWSNESYIYHWKHPMWRLE